jgi:hypothetical protein
MAVHSLKCLADHCRAEPSCHKICFDSLRRCVAEYTGAVERVEATSVSPINYSLVGPKPPQDIWRLSLSGKNPPCRIRTDVEIQSDNSEGQVGHDENK